MSNVYEFPLESDGVEFIGLPDDTEVVITAATAIDAICAMSHLLELMELSPKDRRIVEIAQQAINDAVMEKWGEVLNGKTH